MAPTLPPKLQEIVDKSVAEAVAKVQADADAKFKVEIEKREAELVLAKMSKEHKAYHDNLPADEQKRFAAMTPDQRDEHMNKTKKRAEEDPIYKGLQQENIALSKRLAAIEDERGLELAKREAKELGMKQDNVGEMLLKAKRSMDKEAYEVFTDHIRTMNKQNAALAKSAHVFEELGTSQGNNSGSALDELRVLATEYRKTHPDITEEQAFDKVMTDTANRELVKREAAERFNKINRVA
jgi:hypothetical protein